MIPSDPARPPTNAEAPPRVCICDDDPVIAGLLGASLAEAGFQVQEPLTNVEQAMGWLSVDPPDVLLLDLNMPAGGGLDLLGWMRSDGLLDRVQVLMLTGEHDLWFIDRARELGARGYLTKPADGAGLVAKVRRLLADRRVAWIDDLSAVTRPEPAAPVAATGADAGVRSLNPVVADLAEAYGEETASGLLRALAEHLARMDAASRGEADPAETAHAVKGAAASLGFAAVAQACGALETAARAGGPVAPQMREAAEACARARADIAGRLRLS